MYALVLTFDKYKPFAQHMIMCYEELWPNNPFIFRVPYQSENVKTEYEQKFGEKVEMIKSPSGIVDTMFTLSDDLDEKDWVYWCMDDRYPICLNLKEVAECYNYINFGDSGDVCGLMFCSNTTIWSPEHNYGRKDSKKINELKIVRRKDYTMIWNHQFLRVVVVRTFFHLFPRIMKQAKEMDYIKDKSHLPDAHKLYMLNHNAGIYGESTNRGVITRNCAESFSKHGIQMPEGFEISDKILLKGNNTIWDNRIVVLKYYIKKILEKV